MIPEGRLVTYNYAHPAISCEYNGRRCKGHGVIRKATKKADDYIEYLIDNRPGSGRLLICHNSKFATEVRAMSMDIHSCDWVETLGYFCER
jgi:hypothetical protein